MTRKICAVWLVALVLLPVSAPFPTCDLLDLSGRTAVGRHTPAEPPAQRASVDDPTTLLVAATAERLKLTGLSAFRSIHSVAPTTTALDDLIDPVGQLRTPPVPVSILRL